MGTVGRSKARRKLAARWPLPSMGTSHCQQHSQVIDGNSSRGDYDKGAQVILWPRADGNVHPCPKMDHHSHRGRGGGARKKGGPLFYA